MKQVRRIVLFALVVSLGCWGATVIDFNDGVNGAEVGSFYSGLGVTFSNAQFDDFPCFGICTNISGLKIAGIGPDFQPTKGNPIVNAVWRELKADNAGCSTKLLGVLLIEYDTLEVHRNHVPYSRLMTEPRTGADCW